ncbi:MAG: ShlB/FhaC/HecB family hemolysin secretion/activation protein [Burkholderiales bacterium]|nr:hypothetical protein [Burkholderiales bacterium]MDE1925927.1 ShlB/FhaC/HecB family hemolysin secretion/activation protein [Burkholderiales bacterium]MDE2158180.1 ShlB/FhaC/HecB family hemolysin secretion/activation protein [Burkholderiales bacterium]MDE2502014.1 ShlB/FhaC/HecB family hemolysin secretion/activation protein [Burkholderiales bacterium]
MRQTERDRAGSKLPPTLPALPLDRAQVPQVAAPGAAEGPRVTVRQFDFAGNRLLGSGALQSAVAPWLGHADSVDDLRRAAAAVEQAYRERGWLARALLPVQDISGGRVRIEIVEARMGRVIVARGSAALPARLVEQIRLILAADLPAGQPLDLHRLERGLIIAGEIPGVLLRGSLAAGADPARTDLLLELHPAARTAARVGIDNGGNRATGATRLTAQVTALAPLGGGERLSVALAATEGSAYLGGDASWPVALAALAQWRIGLHASALEYTVLPGLNPSGGAAPRGHSGVLGVGLEYPLRRTPFASATLQLGIGARTVVNRNGGPVDPALPTPADESKAGLLQIGIAASRYEPAWGGATTAGSLTLSAGHLSLAGSPASAIAADAAYAHTQGGYAVARWSASHLQPLRPGLALLASAQGQWASTNLDPAEKLYLGGMNGVRAYPTGEAGGSSGWLLNLELRRQLGPHWLASAFVDRGQIEQFRRNAAAATGAPLLPDNRATLGGRGIALEFRDAQGLVVKASWSHRNGRNPLATPAGTDTDGSLQENRYWIDASFNF